jgi:aromatic-L-amino-acid/L-tryptophan decarboxylase
MEDFLKNANKITEWIDDYLNDSERYPVLSQVKPGDIRKKLPSAPPEKAESFDSILRDFQEIILPGVTHWNHPAFFAYFAITGSAPGVLGEMLSQALNVNAMLWKTGPAATELEEVCIDWLRQMVGLPAGLFGMIMDTASVGTMCALAAAREKLQLQIREKGMAGRSDLPALRIYASEHTHSSIDKAAIVLGFGVEGLRKIPADSEFRMRAEALRGAIEEDLTNGIHPVAVVATIGTTSTTSVDPVSEIADICEKYHLWLHVDAAYAGSAAILPEKRSILNGVQRADSFLMNPHKWLFVPFDCTTFYTRHPKILAQAFSLVPEYLRTGEDSEVHNFMDYGIQLGRRFRALKLWMVIRMFGVEGLQQALRKHLQLAQEFAQWVDRSENFERMAPVPFSLVCFRAHPQDASDLNALNLRLMDAVNATGKAYLSHTKLNGQTVLRMAIGHLKTEREHIERTQQLLEDCLGALAVELK